MIGRLRLNSLLCWSNIGVCTPLIASPTFIIKKIERFFSRFWNPGTAGVDAFFQSWQNENCLLVPPVTLVCETLKHMDRDPAVGTSVVPDWPSSAFWPLLLGHYKNAI